MPLHEREAHASSRRQARARAGTWAGSLWPPLAVVAGGRDPESRGLNPVVPALEQASLEGLLRHVPILPFLSPAPAVFGGRALVRDATSGERYSAGSLGAWLRDSGAQQASVPTAAPMLGARWWERTVQCCPARLPRPTGELPGPLLQAADVWERSRELMESGGPPPVPTYCLFGKGKPALLLFLLSFGISMCA